MIRSAELNTYYSQQCSPNCPGHSLQHSDGLAETQ